MLFILGGLLLGVFIGALPGLGPTMVIAIFMPLVIGMESTAAIMFLIGIYVGGIYGGSVSAIWINTPGTPAAAATVLDGYTMNRNGKPMRALQTALYASIFGHFFGSGILFVASEPLASLGLKFGPPEQFTLVLFALTIISAVSDKNMKKGLASAVFGLLLCCIGTDPITGSRRLYFGIIGLSEGIELFAILIGLFAVSEVLVQLSRLSGAEKKEIKTSTVIAKDDRMPVREFFSHWALLLRSSFIGTFIGALPGIGSGTSSFVAYGWAKKLSRHPERFGNGSEEGIIAAESSNNACCGGALIPLFALGIPGDTVTAVLLGAMVMHGLAPGPLLFIQHGNEVRAIFLAIVFCGILLVVLGQLILRASSFMVRVSERILWPIILVICVVGVFATSNSVLDVRMMLLFGLVGIVMNKYEFPTAPLLIAYILGSLLETSLRQTLLLSEEGILLILHRPLALLFFAAAVISVCFPLISRAVSRKQAGSRKKI